MLGKRPTRIVHASMIDFGISLASLIQMPVSSRERSFLTSSGRSRARKITSRSMSPFLIWCVYGTDHVNLPQSASGNQSSHVLIVVVRNCGLVFRMMAHRDFLIPSGPFFCSNARRKTSTQHPTDLPLPTGPLIPRKNVLSFIKDFSTSPSGLYLNSPTSAALCLHQIESSFQQPRHQCFQSHCPTSC